MSTAFSTYVGPPGVGTISLPVSPLTTQQYLQMIEAGILTPSEKVELIGGLITPMAPSGSEHNSSLIVLTEMFASVLGRFRLQIQGTLIVAEGQVFDPDLALLKRKNESYRRALPRAEDVLLIIESAASSLKLDRHIKLPAYAAAGIQEYWIVDLDKERVAIHRDPEGVAYRSEQTLTGDAVISPLVCPELTIRVADIFA